jgi:hypothetical protein
MENEGAGVYGQYRDPAAGITAAGVFGSSQRFFSSA